MSIKNIIRAWKDEDYRAQPERGRAGAPAAAPGGAHRAVGRRDGRHRGRLRLLHLLAAVALHACSCDTTCRGHRPLT